jgi:hypothetical protein
MPKTLSLTSWVVSLKRVAAATRHAALQRICPAQRAIFLKPLPVDADDPGDGNSYSQAPGVIAVAGGFYFPSALSFCRNQRRKCCWTDSRLLYVFVSKSTFPSSSTILFDARNLDGFAVHFDRPGSRGSKDQRAEPWAGQLEAGNVVVCRNHRGRG